MMSSILLLLLSAYASAEVRTPSSLLRPSKFNHHAFDAKNFLLRLKSNNIEKQGPVLFPNDGPPPPRQPLIVTSRPLLESIARSELGNNSLPESSQLNSVVRPFLARVKEYKPFQYLGVTEAPAGFTSAGREDYEERTTLPPIYKVLSNHAKQKLIDIQRQKHKSLHDYQVKEPEYNRNYNNRHISHDAVEKDDQNNNYAFSYRVKDQKTGDDFSHTQHSTGSATNGEYRVRLPDGRMQIVSYTADENGYQANVRYDDDDKTVGNRIDDHVIDHHKNYYDNHYYGNTDHDYINDKLHNNDYSQNVYNEKHDLDSKTYESPLDKTNDKYTTATNNDYYSDVSKEYYNDDFSTEYENKNYDYAPHRSKFSTFINQNADVTATAAPNTNFASGSTVTPTYDELKDLLVTKKAYNTIQPYATKIPVEINSPATTPSIFDGTTEKVVVIGAKKPNVYTRISNNLPFLRAAPISVTPEPFKYDSNFAVSPTPRSYLISTIANLRNKAVDLSGPKPILSQNYIDRINKYLRYN